jgi:polysaccharide pyruvyl transferase WcaK-like protein
MNRRTFAFSSFPITLTAAWQRRTQAASGSGPKILLRSSWQTVNIGDIAHTPGVLALLERHLPEASVTLWPSRVDNGVDAMLLRRFPGLNIVRDGNDLSRAFDECDFLLHGSGPSLVAEKDVVRWSESTGKPYGIYGITFAATESTATVPRNETALKRTIGVFDQARFVYFRDSVSLGLAKRLGCRCPVLAFGPDGAFSFDGLDNAWSDRFLEHSGLEPGRFMCSIPRLRYTPYWTIPEKKTPRDDVKHARNEAMKEHDHAPHRQAIVDLVRNFDMKVLICPEDRTQMAVGQELLFNPLPPDVRNRCVRMAEYWLPSQAVAVYARSAGLFGNEMHSPIMAVGRGIPAIVCRWAEQTSKGFMWKDIGLGDWLFDFDDEAQVAKLPEAVASMASNPAQSKAKAEKARDFALGQQAVAMKTLRESLGLKA